jgi:hypothetical protein
MGFHHRKLFVSVDRLLEQNLHEESKPFCINCLQMLLWIMFSFLGMAMGFVQSYWPTTGFFLFCFCLFPFIYFYMIIVTKVVVKTFFPFLYDWCDRLTGHWLGLDQALFTINGCLFFTIMMGVMNIATRTKGWTCELHSVTTCIQFVLIPWQMACSQELTHSVPELEAP